MAIDLNKPLTWKSASAEETALLENLQGNILKGHGREHATLLFIRFKKGAAAKARSFLRKVTTDFVGSAKEQLDASEEFKCHGTSGRVFVTVSLSSAGYAALGVKVAKTPNNPAFLGGMKKKRTALNDPKTTAWELGYRGAIHALIVIADDLEARIAKTRGELEELLKTCGKVVAREDGHGLRNQNNDHIEHFGYVDGRSQPLMLQEDIQKETTSGGIDQWSPTFGLNVALVPDLGDPGAVNFGSYFVFRKLEQDVRTFKAEEKKLAKKLKLNGEAAELAGALAVGRFEDGTPVVLQKTDGIHPVPNNFSYDADPSGGKCPFHAHIRKTNPRGDSVRQFGVSIDDERSHLMPRRGIPFGRREVHPSDPILDEHPELYPTGGVGLLFMAYNAEIERQFEFTQISWANSTQFAGNTGVDPIIAQTTNPAGFQKWPVKWGQAGKDPSTPFSFANFVTMKGGEYFFTPCLSFLKKL